MKITILSAVLLVIFSITLTVSCKKEVNANSQNNNPSPISVLKNNSQFETVYGAAHVRNAFTGGVLGTIGLYDFTIEGNTALNLAYYTTTPTQQDEIKTLTRKSISLINWQELALPAKAGENNYFPTTSFGEPAYKFFPYSNILSSVQAGGGNGFVFYFFANHDVKMEHESAAILGGWDISYRHFVRNQNAYNHGTFSTTGNSNFQIGDLYTMFLSPRANVYTTAIGLNNVYYGSNGLAQFATILINYDSVYVYKYNYTSFFGTDGNPIYTISRVNQLQQLNPITFENFYTIRHYSTDGQIMTFAMVNTSTNMINTYRYNLETNLLEQNLSNVLLEYSGANSDIALDDDANLYYSGYASYGSNSSGVSIYKKSGSGASTLVGSDDFLLSGTIVGLKYLYGKIYIAITANQTQAAVHQISIVRQK